MTHTMTALAPVGEVERAAFLDLARISASGDAMQLQEQLRRTGGCSSPIHLRGFRKLVHAPTGAVWSSFSTDQMPAGRLRLACGNRRASRCPSCAHTYAGDTFHLIRAGLVGDPPKGVPQSVRSHPRVFATLTAPSFGPVHNQPQSGRCRCGCTHPPADPALGTPLDAGRYDYAHAVLWNNHAPDLWRRFSIALTRQVARRVGLSRTEFGKVARVTFGKVAEYQRRGAVHFHAVIRLDGPEGADAPPPSWATVALLDGAIRAAAADAGVPVAASGHLPARVLRWGAQVDVQPIGGLAFGEITEQRVASYVAKYATKAAEATQSVDHRLGERAEIGRFDLPEHTRRLIETCWDLDDLYPDRLLAHWSHMLGFRGHFSSKSPTYSTTLGALRQVRADFRAEQEHERLRQRLLDAGLPDLDDVDQAHTLVLAHWSFAGAGLSPGESLIAAGIRDDIAFQREIKRELLAEQEETRSWQ